MATEIISVRNPPLPPDNVVAQLAVSYRPTYGNLNTYFKFLFVHRNGHEKHNAGRKGGKTYH
jgi:hypothetical protein